MARAYSTLRIEPTNCSDCPLCAESCFCQHPARINYSDDDGPVMHVGADETRPSWCPLSEQALLIWAKP